MKWYHALVFLLIFTGGGAYVYQQTRGIRNKNPGNIRYNVHNDWKGQVDKDDKGFVIFSHAKYGVRAMGKTIDSYRRRGVITVADIISTWAPSNENDTNAYIKSVLKQTGWDWYHTPTRLFGGYIDLIKAIIKHENGFNPYSDNDIENWLDID